MYEEIQDNYPLEFALRDQDKYRYRYPKGEVSLIMQCSYVTIVFHINAEIACLETVCHCLDFEISKMLSPPL